MTIGCLLGVRASGAAVIVAVALPLAVAGWVGGAAAVAGRSRGEAASSALTPPTQNMTPQTSIGKGEGQLNLIAWEGYAQPEWVKPFEQQTGCQVNAKYAGSSSEMVSLMANGGGGQYDLVSASGDADLRLIYGGDVKPVNISLIPSWKEFRPFLKSPAFNTINGEHYGVSLQFGPNDLLYSTKIFPKAPDVVVGDLLEEVRGTRSRSRTTRSRSPTRRSTCRCTAQPRDHRPVRAHPDPVQRGGEPAQAAEAAHQGLLEPRLRRDLPVPERRDGRRSGVAVPDGPAEGRGRKVADTIPSEGATGWADTWMLAAKAPHPNCAYKWMAYISTPKIQAEQAVSYGETPANSLACPTHEQAREGLVRLAARQRAGRVLQDDQVLEDPARPVRQRQERLCPVPGLGHRLDTDHRLTA